MAWWSWKWDFTRCLLEIVQQAAWLSGTYIIVFFWVDGNSKIVYLFIFWEMIQIF